VFNKNKSYFKGWYFKHTGKDGSIAFIPSYHIDRWGNKSSNLQIITSVHSFNLEFPYEDLSIRKEPLKLSLGNNIFSLDGIYLDIKAENFSVKAEIKYTQVTPLNRDIMGPFQYLPMQCRHGVISMYHKLSGYVKINGTLYDFNDGLGYIETDSGSSFPRAYLWTQCSFYDDFPCSIMLSIADIPMLMTHFKGCICAIFYKGKDYRLATYNGVKVLQIKENRAIIKQKNLLFSAELLKNNPKELKAPKKGELVNTIHESISSEVRYRLLNGDEIIFDFISYDASFEFVN